MCVCVLADSSLTVCVCVCVCVCVLEDSRLTVCVCVCVCACVLEDTRLTVCVCVLENSRLTVCVCVCVYTQSLRSLLGEELSDYLSSGERKLENLRSRVRLLRDLRLDTRAKGMWARILSDPPAQRRHKSGMKKGVSSSRSGCFGHKMDRIGTISGMGC